MKPVQIAVIAVAAGAVVLGMLTLRQSLTPYVSFAEAAVSRSPVQVAGRVAAGSARVDEEGFLRFTLAGEGDRRLDVRYAGAKPGNFDDAETVVIAGRMDGAVFEARRLLVKCPSKYEGRVSE